MLSLSSSPMCTTSLSSSYNGVGIIFRELPPTPLFEGLPNTFLSLLYCRLMLRSTPFFWPIKLLVIALKGRTWCPSSVALPNDIPPTAESSPDMLCLLLLKMLPPDDCWEFIRSPFRAFTWPSISFELVFCTELGFPWATSFSKSLSRH